MTRMYSNDHGGEYPVMGYFVVDPRPTQVEPIESDYASDSLYYGAALDYFTLPRRLADYGDAAQPRFDESLGVWEAGQPWACPSDRGNVTEPPPYSEAYSTSYYYAPGYSITSVYGFSQGLLTISGKAIGQVWDDWVPVSQPDGAPTVTQLPVILDGCIAEGTDAEPKDWHQGGSRWARGAQAVFADGSAGWNNLDPEDIEQGGPLFEIFCSLAQRANLPFSCD